MPLTAEQITTEVQASIDKLIAKPGALLPILHDIQETLGYIPPEAVGQVAKALNQSSAEIHGVITFYHQFRIHPVGKHNVEICRAEACQAMGSRTLERHAKASLGIDYHQTTRDGAIFLEPVYCLGNCACSPSVRIGDRVHARVTPERFDALMEELGTEKLEVLNG